MDRNAFYGDTNSVEIEKFVLKGASFSCLAGQNYRTTATLTSSVSGSPDFGAHKKDIVLICVIKILWKLMAGFFDAASVKTSSIQDNQEYSGVRVKIRALLERARIDLQIDIGFGDAITPAPELLLFPPLLDAPGPNGYSAYLKYTAMAEKFLAMTSTGY